MTVEPLDATMQVGRQPVRVQVRGVGRPVLLLNGIGAPLELWDPLVHRLTGVRTVAMDTPGSGGSPAPDLPLSIRGHARLALGVIDQLGYDEISVLGLSFGGMVAQELGHLAGTRVRRLVLASTSCGWGGLLGTPEVLLALTTPERYYARQVLGIRNGAGDGATDPVRQGHDSGDATAVHLPDHQGHLYQFLAAATWSSLPWLWQVTQPTLVVTGDRDTLVPPVNAGILATMLPNARLHVVPGGEHLCLLQQARDLAPMLAAHLAG